MPTEIKSLLTLLLPIIFVLIVGIIGTLKEYGSKNFSGNLLDTLFGGVDIVLYVASLYYIYILFEHIEADVIMKNGLKIIVGGCWLIWVFSKVLGKPKDNNDND